MAASAGFRRAIKGRKWLRRLSNLSIFSSCALKVLIISVYRLNGDPISFKTTRQSCVAGSSGEEGNGRFLDLEVVAFMGVCAPPCPGEDELPRPCLETLPLAKEACLLVTKCIFFISYRKQRQKSSAMTKMRRNLILPIS